MNNSGLWEIPWDAFIDTFHFRRWSQWYHLFCLECCLLVGRLRLLVLVSRLLPGFFRTLILSDCVEYEIFSDLKELSICTQNGRSRGQIPLWRFLPIEYTSLVGIDQEYEVVVLVCKWCPLSGGSYLLFVSNGRGQSPSLDSNPQTSSKRYGYPQFSHPSSLVEIFVFKLISYELRQCWATGPKCTPANLSSAHTVWLPTRNWADANYPTTGQYRTILVNLQVFHPNPITISTVIRFIETNCFIP